MVTMMNGPHNSQRVLFAIAVCLVLSIAEPGLSTDRYYRDITATSANGWYRFDAKSPDNVDDKYSSFQRDFLYTLVDQRSSNVLWTRTQPKEGEASPCAAWVHDSGWVVVYTGWNELMVFSSASNLPTGRVKILDHFPKGERAKYVHETTAGPMWTKSSQWYFAEIAGKPHFVVRAWWGRRVIVELASGAIVKDEGIIRTATENAERKEMIAVLERASKLKVPNKDESKWPMAAEVTTAAYFVGRNGIRDAVPFLRELEKWEYCNCSVAGGDSYGGSLAEGMVDPFVWREFGLRLTVQTALRRLGSTPQGIPATQFRYHHADYNNQKPVIVALADNRADFVDLLKPGMTPLEVLRTMDAPDVVEYVTRPPSWEYDIDAVEPFTLRVQWHRSDPPAVAKITRIVPPRWKDGHVRDDR